MEDVHDAYFKHKGIPTNIELPCTPLSVRVCCLLLQLPGRFPEQNSNARFARRRSRASKIHKTKATRGFAVPRLNRSLRKCVSKNCCEGLCSCQSQSLIAFLRNQLWFCSYKDAFSELDFKENMVSIRSISQSVWGPARTEPPHVVCKACRKHLMATGHLCREEGSYLRDISKVIEWIRSKSF